MNALQRAAVVPEPRRSGTGVTVRPPRILLADQQSTGSADEQVPAERRQHMLNEGLYTRLPVPSVVVYRVQSGEHQQTGVVVEASLDDYRTGRIRRHEATYPERERHLAELTETTGYEDTPVTLTHPPHAGLRLALAEVTSAEPDLRLTMENGSVHTVWARRGTELVRAVQHALDHIDTLYLADGHHRMAAAERRASQRGHTDGSGGFTLAALFPSDEMRILGYHRCIARPAGMSTADLLAALAAQPMIAQLDEAVPAEAAHLVPGTVAMYFDGRWYRLRIHAARDTGQVRDSLDVVALDEGILAPALGITNVEQHAWTTSPSGGAEEMARWCAERDALGFLLAPPSIEQVMAVSDAGQVMPPKSTWFAPKSGSGLFLRELARQEP